MLNLNPRCAENSFCVRPLASKASATWNHSCFSTGFDIPARVHHDCYPGNASRHVARRTVTEYMLKLWGGLTVFLRNPVVPIDNNHVERQMRDMVMGRKNHYGSKSQRGTKVTALFYSLIETARLRGEDPGHYLRRAALAAIENPGTVTLPKTQD